MLGHTNVCHSYVTEKRVRTHALLLGHQDILGFNHEPYQGPRLYMYCTHLPNSIYRSISYFIIIIWFLIFVPFLSLIYILILYFIMVRLAILIFILLYCL